MASLSVAAGGMVWVRRWLVIVAVLVAGMVLLGGATRLTDSGLSITEWRPVTGLVPPIGEEAWLDEFIKYQGIPEYQIVNQGMTLDEFKTIYWWEWAHRNLGRFIGVVFAVPLIWFAVKGVVRGRLALRLSVVLALGGVQAFVGWFMVQSGLTEGVDVSQYRLAAHLAVAVLILGAILWIVFDLDQPADAGSAAATGLGPPVLLALVLVQIVAGAFVAGLDAGRIYNTWPLMDGALVPDGLFIVEPWWLNLFENVLTVQFDHRMLAYVLLAAAAWHAVATRREDAAGPMAASARMLFVAILVQIVLGIAALVYEVQIVPALVHQAGALVVFAVAVRHLFMARRAAPAG